MKKIAHLLKQGENYFGSGCCNSEQFNKFFAAFKNAFKKELATINAELVSINKGHFYLSGFFKIGSGDLYYFSISDVRHFPGDTMLFRTAKHTKDFTGGSNQWVTIGEGMAKKMKVFG